MPVRSGPILEVEVTSRKSASPEHLDYELEMPDHLMKLGLDEHQRSAFINKMGDQGAIVTSAWPYDTVLRFRLHVDADPEVFYRLIREQVVWKLDAPVSLRFSHRCPHCGSESLSLI